MILIPQLPDSYAEAALGVTQKIDMAKARAQHTAYVETLRTIVPNIKVLPADEKFPDCVFVEDPAIVVGGHALLTQPGDPSRRGETQRMRRVLRDEIGLIVMEGMHFIELNCRDVNQGEICHTTSKLFHCSSVQTKDVMSDKN